MQTEQPKKSGSQKMTRSKIFKLLAALSVVLILLAVLLVPAYISSEPARKMILTRINRSVDGKADFADLSMGWLKGIRITGISFNENSGQTSVEVKQIAAKPHYASILMGNLSFGETVVDEPKVEINLKARQPTQIESPAQMPAEKPEVIGLPIKKIDLVINNGRLKVTGKETGTVELSQINSKLNLRPPGQKTNFDVDMAVTDKEQTSKIRANGQIRPETKGGWTLKKTSGDLTVQVDNLNINSLEPLFALAGVEIQTKGIISAKVKSEIKDGNIENLIAEFKGSNLDITGHVLKGDRLKSAALDVAVKLNRQKDLINIEEFDFRSDWAKAQASGAFPTTFKSLAEFLEADSTYNLKGSFECNLAEAASQMPRIFGLKEGIKITSGQIIGDIQTSAQAGQRKIVGQAKLENLESFVAGKQVALSEPVTAEVNITSDKEGIKFDKLNVSSAFCKIDCSGSTSMLKYGIKADLTKLQDELGQFINTGQYKIDSILFCRGEVAGNKDRIAGNGIWVFRNLSLSSTNGTSAFEPEIATNFSFIAEPPKNIVTIDFLKANAGFGQVGIKDAVLPLNEKAVEPARLMVTAGKVDLEKIRPFAIVLASFPQQMLLAGTANSQISISGKKGIYRIATDSTKIENLKVSYPEHEPFEQSEVSIAFDAEIDPANKTVNVKKLQLTSPQIKIKGNLQQTSKDNKTDLRGQVDCEYDWSAVSTIAAPFLPKSLKLEGQRTDAISFASQYAIGKNDEMLANLNSKGKLGFDRGEYMGLELGPTEVNVEIQNGLLTIAPFSTTVNNGQLQFAASADFNRKPTLLKTPQPIQIIKNVQINDKTTRKLLMYLNPVFANTVNVSGVANFNCERLAIPLAGDSKNDIEVVGTISIDQLRLQGSGLLSQILSAAGTSAQGKDITIHPTSFALQGGFLRYDDMQMDVGSNPINFHGVIGLDKSLNMKVILPYTTSGTTARVGQETEGQRISLSLRGTTDHPELDVGKLLEEQIKEKLQEKLREGLEGLLK